MSACKSREKAKLRPANTLSKVSLHHNGTPDAVVALSFYYNGWSVLIGLLMVTRQHPARIL